jgi:hypothetical protein
VRDTANTTGIVLPEQLKLLAEVFEETEVIGETPRQREARASRILSYFQLGITDRDELRTLVRSPWDGAELLRTRVRRSYEDNSI